MGGTLVWWLATLPHSKEVLGLNPLSLCGVCVWSLWVSVWSLHVVPVFVWVIPKYSDFLPQCRDTQLMALGELVILHCSWV